MTSEPLSRLARYIEETGTKQAWLARRLGVAPSMMSRWVTGQTPMRHEDRVRLLEVLRERAAIDLGGLLDDLPTWTQRDESGTPFERALRRGRGAQDPDRHSAPVRQVARCCKCGRDREGVTRFESMAYSNRYAIGDPIHFCDECAAAIEERPVEQALLEAAHQVDIED